MKRVLKNAVGDLLTTLLGGLAGLPQIIEGVATKDTTKIIEGVAIFLLGLVSNSKNNIQ